MDTSRYRADDVRVFTNLFLYILYNAINVNNFIFRVILSFLKGKSSKGCQTSCQQLQYSGKIKNFPTQVNDDIELAFRFPSTKILNYEEYLIYDFNGMIGAVGGSLGMFLGFSFLDFVFSFIDFIYEKMNYSSYPNNHGLRINI